MLFPKYLAEHIDNTEEIIKVKETIYGLNTRVNEQKRDSKDKRSKLVIISGLSGAGKDTVTKALIEKDARFGWIKTCTTRKDIRPDESENDPYIRLSEEDFRDMEKNGDVIESVCYAGNYYCSLRSVFEEAFNKFQFPILRIDPKGAENYTNLWRKGELFFNEVNLMSIFVVPPTIDELRQRLIKRSGDMAFVEKRMSQLESDLNYLNSVEYFAINETDKIGNLINDILEIVAD